MIEKDEAKLTAFVLGELSAAERSEIEQAIAASPELQHEVDEIRETISLLEAGFTAEPDDTQPAMLVNTSKESVRVTRRNSRRWFMIAVTAACTLLLVGGIYFYGLDSRSQFGISQATNGESNLNTAAGKKSLEELNAEFQLLLEEGRYSELEAIGETAYELYPDSADAEELFLRGKMAVRSRQTRLVTELAAVALENKAQASEWESNSRAGRRYLNLDLINMEDVPTSEDSAPLEVTEPIEMLSELESLPPEIALLPSEEWALELDEMSESLAPTSEITQSMGTLRASGVERNSSVSSRNARVRKTGGSPSPEEIDRLKQEILDQSAETERNTRQSVVQIQELVAGTVEGSASRPKTGGIDELLNKGSSEDGTKEGLQPKSWKRVAAIPNTSRLMVGDKDELAMQGMQVRVKVDGFRARVILDCLYHNDRDRQLEGTFKLRLPNDASLYYFAFGESAHQYTPDLKPEKLQEELIKHEFPERQRVNDIHNVSFLSADLRADREGFWDLDHVKEARVVPQEKAAFAYGQTVRRKIDPALVEWAGAGVFNARVFPLVPHQMHRIVIGYDVNLQEIDDQLIYQLDLPEETGICSIDVDFAASDVRVYRNGNAEAKDDSLLNVKPQIENGRAHFHFYKPELQALRFELAQPENLLLVSPTESDDKFFAASITPPLPADQVAGSKQAIFLVDTSLSSNPDKFNVWLAMLRATLEANRDSMKQFAVFFFDVDSHWWENGYTANTPENVERLLADCQTLSLEGATDLHAAFYHLAHTEWLKQYVAADLFLLSDAAATWGETNLAQINRQLESANLGSLFAYQTGLTGTDSRALQLLAQKHGGAVFHIGNEAEIARAATAHRHRPWLLKSMSAGKARDLLAAGRVETVYPGQSLLIAGRGAPDKEITLEFVRGDEQKTIQLPVGERIESELAERVYGQIAVGQLESLGRFTEDVAVAYARHFRVPGETCSLLMLDSEADYERFHIKPEDDRFVVNSSNASSLIEKKLAAIRDQLADPQAEMIAWLERLEKSETLKFKLPTALRIALDDIPRGAYEVNAFLPQCKLRRRPNEQAIDIVKLAESYDAIQELAKTRRGEWGTPDALRTLSNLVEQHPGDHVLSRDIAFTAMQWDQPAAAYYLLRRVALTRPYEGHVYTALGHCLAQLERTELAMIFYEVAMNGDFPQAGADFRQIAAVEYMSMLKDVVAGRRMSAIPDYAHSRYQSLKSSFGFDEADLIVSMMWNIDRSDVDLHVVEPSGEVCFYQHRDTQAGGHITQDITTGFGPEMYTLRNAAAGTFIIKAKYYGSDAMQSSVRAKVLVTIYEHFGSVNQIERRETVTLEKTDDVIEVAKVKIAE